VVADTYGVAAWLVARDVDHGRVRELANQTRLRFIPASLCVIRRSVPSRASASTVHVTSMRGATLSGLVIVYDALKEGWAAWRGEA
jgi:hypothetical protein